MVVAVEGATTVGVVLDTSCEDVVFGAALVSELVVAVELVVVVVDDAVEEEDDDAPARVLDDDPERLTATGSAAGRMRTDVDTVLALTMRTLVLTTVDLLVDTGTGTP